MYKMLTIDVDDTLLNDDRIVTEATKSALKEAIQRGVVVTLATGRMFAAAKPIAAQLEINVPLITYQGSLVKNLLDGAILYERHIPIEIARQVFEYALERNLHIQTYADDVLYSLKENEKIRRYSQISKVPYVIEPDVEKLLAMPLTKVLLFEEPETLIPIEDEFQSLFGDHVHITRSKPYFLEILHKEATKGHAVKFLAQHFGCDLKDVIAIGDSWNDNEMIQIAGLGVAMGNAISSLKEIADYVTLTNNEDGVKHVIETFILSKEGTSV